MADNKLIWTELRRALMRRAGVTEKEANAFLTALNNQLVEGLKNDKQVKINGLGTFKLQAVAPRKSVNVTTGEQIIIEGYNKIAFVPELGVKELVESGETKTANGESDEKNEVREAIDPIKKLGAQAEEIKDILGELGQSPDQSVVEPKLTQKPEPEPEPEPKQAVEPEPAPELEPEPAVDQEHEPVSEEPKPTPKPKSYHFVRDTLICVVILLLMLLVGYFFLRNQLSDWIEELTQSAPVEMVNEEMSEEMDEQETEVVDEGLREQPAEEIEWTYDDILLTENLTEGSRLAWLAKKHYGNKDYWPYIYAANKDRLSNPSLISVGTPIRVPRLTDEQRDLSSERFQRLREEAYQAIKE